PGERAGDGEAGLAGRPRLAVPGALRGRRRRRMSRIAREARLPGVMVSKRPTPTPRRPDRRPLLEAPGAKGSETPLAALDLPAPKRKRWLAGRTDLDAALRREVASLLEAAERAGPER